MITIKGKQYVIVKETLFEVYDALRTEFCLRLPKGRKLFYAVRYENGEFSEVV